ncbi:hypothetical protein D3C85_1032180 [compost metagenome]
MRSTETLADGVGAAPVPSKVLAVPKPTKSIICVPVGLPPVRAIVTLANNTLPPPAAMGMVPVASGVGRLTVPPEP